MKTVTPILVQCVLAAGLAGHSAYAQIDDAVSSDSSPKKKEIRREVRVDSSSSTSASSDSQNGSAGFALAQAASDPFQTGLEPQIAYWSDDGKVQFGTLGGSPRPRTLIVRSGEIDDKTTSALEEDLSIMSRVLTKAVKEKGLSDDDLTAMGMRIQMLNPAGQFGLYNLYLDGYGALFLMNVRFPLLAPPKESDDAPAKEAKDSTWDQARQELYGVRERNTRRSFAGAIKSEPFDPQKVADLKEALLESLKNATHIRNLKPGESIIVVVAGPAGTTMRHAENRSNWIVRQNEPNRNAAVGGGGGGTGGYATAGGTQLSGRFFRNAAGASAGDRESLMTLRVKKSDVDDYTKGAIDFEKFKSKVAVTVY